MAGRNPKSYPPTGPGWARLSSSVGMVTQASAQPVSSIINSPLRGARGPIHTLPLGPFTPDFRSHKSSNPHVTKIASTGGSSQPKRDRRLEDCEGEITSRRIMGTKANGRCCRAGAMVRTRNASTMPLNQLGAGAQKFAVTGGYGPGQVLAKAGQEQRHPRVAARDLLPDCRGF